MQSSWGVTRDPAADPVNPGNAEFVEVAVSLVATVTGFVAVVVVDERRLRGAELARAWPAVSRDAAILGAGLFGLLYAAPAVVVHFARTRGGLRGMLMGAAWAAFLVAADLGVVTLISVLVS